MPMISSNPQKLKESMDQSLLDTFQSNQSCWHLALGLPASRTVREYISVILIHLVCGDLFHQHQEMNILSLHRNIQNGYHDIGFVIWMFVFVPKDPCSKRVPTQSLQNRFHGVLPRSELSFCHHPKAKSLLNVQATEISKGKINDVFFLGKANNSIKFLSYEQYYKNIVTEC